MSGPITAEVYVVIAVTLLIKEEMEKEIKRRQLELEEEQRRLKEKKRTDEFNKLKDNCAITRAQLENVNIMIKDMESDTDESEKASIGLSRLRDSYKELERALKAIENVDSGSEYEEFHIKNKEVNRVLLAIQDATVKAGDIRKKQEVIYKRKALERLDLDFNVSFNGISNRKQVEENEYIPQILRALEEISVLDLSEELRNRLQVIKDRAGQIDSIDYLQNYYSLTIIPFVKECREYDDLLMQHGTEYESLLCRYKVLTEDVGVQMEKIPFGKNAVSELLERISTLEKELLKRKEEEYICDSIDEALIELGYSVAGRRDITKKSGRHFRSELFKVDEGTVVNVSYSDDGQITMELGAADVVDRIPTDNESRSLVEDMTKFCSDYKKVEQVLKAKGIEPNNVSILPAYAEYAQIIDVSEYEMIQDVGKYQARIRSKSEQKQMHKDG